MSTRTMQRSTLAFLIGSAWFLLPNSAYAESQHYQVELSVPPSLPECNREAELMGMIEPMVTRRLLEPPFARAITVRIAKNQAVYRLDVLVKDVDGRPIDEEHAELPASMSCFEVLYRGAIRAALYMNLNTPIEVSKPAPLQCPPPPPPPPPPAPPQCPLCETRKQSPKTANVERHWFAGAGGLVGFGIAPEIVAGVQLLAGWKWSPSWSFEVDARATFPEDTRPLGPTVVRVYSVASIAIAPCYRFGSLGFCGLAMGTNAWARSINVESPHVISVASLGFGGRGLLEHRVSNRWSFRVDVDVVIPVFRMQLEDASRPRWASTPVTGSLAISMLAWF